MTIILHTVQPACIDAGGIAAWILYFSKLPNYALIQGVINWSIFKFK